MHLFILMLAKKVVKLMQIAHKNKHLHLLKTHKGLLGYLQTESILGNL